MREDKDTFRFRYSAQQQEEVRRIREKYLPREEDKMERLRRLDESASRPGGIAALCTGLAGVLLLGGGMSCTLVWGDALFLPGLLLGVVGIVAIVGAYPLYAHITRRRREKLAPEILRLADELSQR